MMQRLTREEQETHITIDTVEEMAIIDTSIPKDINRMKKLGYEVIREMKYEDGGTASVIFRVPRKAISFRNPQRKEMSEAQREALRERARQMRRKDDGNE